MEVLKRKGEASAVSVKIFADKSLSLSFKLPSSYRKPRQVTIEAPKLRLEIGEAKQNTQQQEDQNNTTNSWETIDTWEQQVDMRKNTQAVFGDIDTTEEQWEEEKVPDLPDDFPCLLVNLTRLQKEHLHEVTDEAEPLQQVYNTIKHALYQHFSLMIEVFFEQKLIFHCTYGSFNRSKKQMESSFPKDRFVLMDYPCTIEEIPLHELLVSLSRPSRFKSVEYLKDCLSRSSRDPIWKVQVLEEVEKLAEEEFELYQSQKKALSEEIDQLTRLRDSFQAKLTQKKQKPQQAYILLRKIEDLENRLVQLLDEFLAEPSALEPQEVAGITKGLETQMNVLDMVIAMVFTRLPRDPKVSSQKHYEMLLDHHVHICRLWKKDFGRLPPSRKFPSPQPLEDNQVVTIPVQEKDDMDNWEEWDRLEEDTDDEIEEEERRSVCSEDYGGDYEEEEDEEEVAAVQVQEIEAPVSDKPKSKKKKNEKKKKKKNASNSTKMKPKEPEKEPEKEFVERPFFQPFACTGAIGVLLESKAREQEELFFF